MTTSRRHLTHALMIAALAFGAWAAGEATHQDAAHADKPPAAEQPGGLLGGAVHLPAQAADRAQDVVDEVAPGPAKPKPEPEPKPTKDPKPTKPPAAEPTHAPKPPAEDEPGEPPADVPPVEVPPVEVPPVVVDPPPVVVNPPPVVETPPVVIEPTPIPTVPAPIPTPTLPATPTAPAAEPNLPTLPVVQPAALPTAALPALVPPLPGLPLLIGPTAAPAATIDPARAHDEPLVAALIASLTDAPDCYLPLDNLRRPTANSTTPTGVRQPDTVQQQASGQPCPGHPGSPDGPAITALAVKPPPPTGEQLVADNLAGAYSPALQRLYQLRARGDLPAGRTQHPEPGPA